MYVVYIGDRKLFLIAYSEKRLAFCIIIFCIIIKSCIILFLNNTVYSIFQLYLEEVLYLSFAIVKLNYLNINFIATSYFV